MVEEARSQQGSLSPRVASLSSLPGPKEPAEGPEFFNMSSPKETKETFNLDGTRLLEHTLEEFAERMQKQRQEGPRPPVVADHTERAAAPVVVPPRGQATAQGGQLLLPGTVSAAARVSSGRRSRGLWSQSLPQLQRGGSPSYSSSPRYSMIPRRESPPSLVPGPGAYEPGRTPSPQARSGTFGSSLARPTRRTPSGEHWGVGIGPASYSVVSPPGRFAPSFTMAPKRELSPSTIPGPGAYETTTPCVAAVARSSFATSPKGSPRSSLRGRGTAIGYNRQVDVPGPAAYPAQYAFGKAPSSTMQPRREIPISTVPGPGAYEVSAPKTPRGGFARSPARCPTKVEVAAGPGSYTVPQLLGSGSAFTLQPRRGSPVRPVPGPGAYEHAQGTGTPKGCKASCFGRTTSAARSRSTSRDPDVGPGSYNPTTPKGSPRFSMTPRREARTPDSPGPGAYHKDDALSASPRSHGRFNLAARAKEMRDSYLGPGSYDVISGPVGPGFGIAPQRPKSCSATPGPGAYDMPRALFA